MMTTQTQRNRWLLTAVLAGLPVLMYTSTARAQQQQPVNGRALDANNRIGSGGTNTYTPPPTVGQFGNNVVNGNVTQGKSFHGQVDYSDPNAFNGFTAGRATDNFTRDSSGVGVPNTLPPTPGVATPFFGVSRFAPPPQPGLAQSQTSQGGFVPAPTIVVQPNDLRLGAHLEAETSSIIPKAGQLLLPGPIDPTSNQQTLLNASPLTGIRQLNVGDANDMSFLNRFAGGRPDNVLDRVQMNGRDLQRMREELRVAGATPTGADLKLNNGGAVVGAVAPGVNLAHPMEAPASAALVSQPVNAAVPSGAFTNAPNSEAGTYSRLVGTPQQQSAQYDELKKRLEQYQGGHKSTAEIAAEQFNLAMREKQMKEAKAKALANGTKPDALPADPTKPLTDLQPKPAPLPVKSMAAGVNGQGLKEMLGKAEVLMKEGKFTSAIDEYAAAEQVAPNQPLIWIGRANAELGASYYNRAEGHLKRAFETDKALLMAQYDLRSFLGEDRLQSVIKDLKEVASTDQKSPTPVFLLAYVYYNTGNERRAAGYLDLAEKRSEGKDRGIYKLLREHWTLPAGEEGTTPGDGKLPELGK